MCRVALCCFAWLIEMSSAGSSGLCYYGARYLAPWLARWISPDSAGVIAGLNLYVYVSVTYVVIFLFFDAFF
jgi:hypothetical protein